MNSHLRGTGVALITPFDKARNVDHSALSSLVNHAITCGVEYLVLMGTTAESVTLSSQEKHDAINTITTANQARLPMVIGIGGNNTQNIVEQINHDDLIQFEAILSVSPAYNKPTQEGIYQHFKSIAEATDKDIILYNVPGRTASNIEPETTLRLANDFSNIVAIKEASPNYMQSSWLLKNKPDNFMVISGDDAYALPMILAGGSGVISVIGQAIKQYSEMIRLGLNRQVDEAYKLYYHIIELMDVIYKEGNPAGIKALLEAANICAAHTRLPLIEASDDLKLKIKELYNHL